MNLMLLPLLLAVLAMSNANAQQPSGGNVKPKGVPVQQPSGVQPQQRNGADGKDLTSIIDEVFQPGPVGEDGGDPNINPNSGGEGFTEEYTAENGGDASGDCQCVPYYLCSNNKIITDGVGLIDIRLKDGPCDNYLDVCCEKPQILNKEPDGGEGPDGTGGPGTGGPGIGGPITPRPLTRTGCGQRNPEGVGFRITGDSDGEAQYGEFPWMVALLREDSIDGSDQKLNVYQCGGSLINHKVVLTAAHCVAKKSPRELKIRAGEWDTQTKNELFPHQDRAVSQIIVHEGYYAGALYNDIALLILEHPVEPAENIDIVCLPRQGENMDKRKCFASGWGKDVFGKEGKYQVILKKVELPVVPRPKCVESLRKTRLGPYFKLHESFICAGGEPNRDTCKGDGGSPLVCPYPKDAHHYTQAGIVAWGIGCGEHQTPGVYVNVALFRNWIDEKMSIHHLDSSSYTRPY